MRSDELRHAARYQWRHILPALGIPAEKLTNKHQPCPVCGDRDRYRFDDKDGYGSYICTHCGNGDGFHLVTTTKPPQRPFQTLWVSGKATTCPARRNGLQRQPRSHATKSTAS